jgi:hypothetical protein
MEIDGTQKSEELDAVLGEIRKVFVNHFKCALENVLHDNWYLIFHKRLVKVSICSVVVTFTISDGRGDAPLSILSDKGSNVQIVW